MGPGLASSVEERSLCKKFRHQTVVRISPYAKSFSCAINNSHYMYDPEASKYVGKNLVTSIGIGTTVVKHATSEVIGNVA